MFTALSAVITHLQPMFSFTGAQEEAELKQGEAED
jgi:hypothetical protein